MEKAAEERFGKWEGRGGEKRKKATTDQCLLLL